MDTDDEMRQLKSMAKWILLAVVVFFSSGYYAFQELKFMIWGQTAEATVTNVFETAERRKPLLAVEYTFTDAEGAHHSERDDVPRSWPKPGPKVTVQYLSGVEDSSRLEGHSSTTAVWVFLTCCGLMAFGVFKLYQMASEAVDGPPRRRRR